MEPELDTLHVLDCAHDPFVEFKRHLFVQLQHEVLLLTEADLTPLLLLESMLQKEFSPIPNLPPQVNSDLQRFGKRNMWHGFFPKSLSKWILQEHRTDAWLGKFSIKYILALHATWTERCAICHERTTEMIRTEDH